MEFEEALHGMYDARLKLRLLSWIMATHVPDDRQPPKSPSDLSLAVSLIRRHHILSEPDPPPPGKPLDAYKAAVDSWVDRLSLLLSSTMTEKCWAGICLLGVTCQECNRQRFLDMYTSWFQKLVLHLKPTDPLFVRGAAFASLTDLLSRLGSIGVKREGTALSIKLVQPVLQLLSEEGSKSIWNDGVDLLCTVLKVFPASLKQQSSQVETLIVAKLMEVDISTSLSQKFARCLALLPKAHGDAATWNSLFRRLLLCVNFHLDDAFKGLEDSTMAKKVLASLMPRGQEQTWFLGGIPIAANAMAEGAKKFWQLLVPRVSVLLQCCSYLLVNSFPVQVPVPLTALLALITRILSVDGSPYGSVTVLGMPTSNAHQVSLCCELPALHSCALDLLYATLCGVRSQLLPRAADTVRLLTEYFPRCGVASIRIKLYNISKHLLVSMGVGMASELAPALVDNLLADLKGATSINTSCSLNSPNAGSWAQGVPAWGQLPNTRKRKDPGNMQMDFLALGAVEAGADISEGSQIIAVQIAALEAAEALLTVGGALRSDQWRTEVDAMIANVALIASACSLSPSLVFEDTSKGESLTISSGSFQLAAYKALLASILAPCMHRPPYLSQALTVFRKGRQEAAGTEVAVFCAHALLAVEPLIHPRSLPLVSAPLTAQTMSLTRGPSSENLGAQMQTPVLPLQGGTGSVPTAVTVNNHGYTAQLAPSSLKVNNSGMQIEVEGDPYVYVQEDIESWIVDYGGDQGGLNDGGSSMMVEGFDGEFQAMSNVAQNEAAQLGNVSARQSLADDEDRAMMSMVGDLLTESREISRGNQSSEIATPGNIQVNNQVSGSLKRGHLALKEVDGLPSASEHFASNITGSGLQKMDSLPIASEGFTANPVGGGLAVGVTSVGQEVDVNLHASKGTDLMPSQQDLSEPQQEIQCAALENLGLSSVIKTQNVSESSDSDAIPDIVDGDPDTD